MLEDENDDTFKDKSMAAQVSQIMIFIVSSHHLQ